MQKTTVALVLTQALLQSKDKRLPSTTAIWLKRLEWHSQTKSESQPLEKDVRTAVEQVEVIVAMKWIDRRRILMYLHKQTYHILFRVNQHIITLTELYHIHHAKKEKKKKTCTR